MSELAIVPAGLRYFIAELKMRIDFRSDRAANLAARRAAIDERAERLLARIRGPEQGLARGRRRTD